MDVKVINGALKVFGEEAQMDKAVEELAELIVAIQKFKQSSVNDNTSTKTMMKRVADITDELADVTIIIKQLSIIFGERDVEKRINFKLKRLNSRIELFNGYNPNQKEMF